MNTNRTADRGRQQAYRAEAEVLGEWYSNRAITPLFAVDDARELQDIACDFLDPENRLTRPTFDTSKRRKGSVYFPITNRIVYTVRYHDGQIRAQTVLHEVAHWATPDDVGHGEAWRRTYAKLLAEFIGSDTAARFLTACVEQPLRKARRKRRTFALEQKDRNTGEWTTVTDSTLNHRVRELWGPELRQQNRITYRLADGELHWFRYRRIN